tara:strand:- start:4124 stop:4840 length:717 start_codon:yes stop_codon:yes gene_type:complete
MKPPQSLKVGQSIAQKKYYDTLKWKAEANRLKLVSGLTAKSNPGKALDIGCWTGEFMSVLSKQGWQCKGIDISDEVNFTKEKGFDCVQHDVSTGIPFKDKAFDLVLACEVIEHLVDTDSFLQECKRILVKGGELIVSTPNVASLHNRFILLRGGYPHNLSYNCIGESHVRAFNQEKLLDIIKENGFSIKKIVGSDLSLPILWRSSALMQGITSVANAIGFNRAFPGLFQNIIVKAIKE